MKKRVLSLILCACLVLSICPALNILPATEVFAADTTVTEFYYLSDKDNPVNTMGISGYSNTKPVKDISGLDVTSVTIADGTIVSPTYVAKLESATKVTFTPSSNGVLKIMFVTKSAGKGISLSDGNNTSNYTIASENTMSTISYELTAATTYTITRNGAEAWIFYMSFTPDGGSSGGETPDPDCTHEAANVTAHEATEPTCTAAGNSAYWSCTCGKFFSDAACTNEIAEGSWVGTGAAATGHQTVTAYAANDSTCEVQGNSAYWHCADCGKYFSDEACTAEIEKDSWILPLAAHNYVDGSCSACGAHEPACDHATTTKTTFEAKTPTCKEPGNIAYSICECGAYLDAQGNEIDQANVILAVDTVNGHSWDEGVETTAPTCKVEGVKTYTCSLCGETKTEAISVDPNAHTLDAATTIKVDPTCIANGHESAKCVDCEKWISTVLAAGHNYDAEGECTICGAKNNTDYVHYFNGNDLTDEMVDPEKAFFTITGALKDKPTAMQYNNLLLEDCIKMNDQLNISFQVPANVAAEDDYDGVLILISTVRTLGDGVFTQLTITETKADGTTNTVILTFPADGILVFNVNAGSSYTITKKTTENNLYYIEYVPGYTLNSDSSDRVEGEGSYIVAENERTRVQYLSLAAAVADALAGDVINMLAESSEAVTVTVPLTIMKNGYSVTNVKREGCLSAKEDSKSIVFTGNAHTEGTPVIENEVAATETTDGSYDTVIYCSVCQAELSRVTTIVPATGGDDDYVAMNVQTEVKYTTVSAALEAAESGQEVILLKSTSDKYVIIPVGVTLNLKAFELTADYVVGFNGSYLIADRYSTSNAYGKLVVDQDKVVLGETAYVDGREIMPIWDDTNKLFVFARLGIMGIDETADFGLEITEATDADPESIQFKWKYNGGGSAIADYLADGAEDNALNFVVRLIWTNQQGTAYQDFVFKDEYVEDLALNTNKYFTFVLTDYEELGIDIGTLKVQALVISDTGVMAVSAECSSNALTG